MAVSIFRDGSAYVGVSTNGDPTVLAVGRGWGVRRLAAELVKVLNTNYNAHAANVGAVNPQSVAPRAA